MFYRSPLIIQNFACISRICVAISGPDQTNKFFQSNLCPTEIYPIKFVAILNCRRIHRPKLIMEWIFWKFLEQKRYLYGNAITFGLLRFRELNLRLKGFHSTHNGIKLIVPKSSRATRLVCARERKRLICRNLWKFMYSEKMPQFFLKW